MYQYEAAFPLVAETADISWNSNFMAT